MNDTEGKFLKGSGSQARTGMLSNYYLFKIYLENLLVLSILFLFAFFGHFEIWNGYSPSANLLLKLCKTYKQWVKERA